MTDNWIDSNKFWQGKRVCVTGGGGFLGSVVVGKLHQRGAADVFVPRKADYDLVHLGHRQTEPCGKLKTGGQPRRKLNTGRVEELFGFKSQTTFEEGVQTTIDWYIEHVGDVREIKYE